MQADREFQLRKMQQTYELRMESVSAENARLNSSLSSNPDFVKFQATHSQTVLALRAQLSAVKLTLQEYQAHFQTSLKALLAKHLQMESHLRDSEMRAQSVLTEKSQDIACLQNEAAKVKEIAVKEVERHY